MRIITICILSLLLAPLHAQDKSLPYYEIPAYADKFTAGTVAARMVDGLGFRYYWATEGLRESDLVYKPGPDTRTTLETLTHIHEMSFMIVNSTTKTPNVATNAKPKITFAEMRIQTLQNLKHASEILRDATDEQMRDFKLVFTRGQDSVEYPFWHQINGPIADCLWHIGQVVSFRRASGNPFTDKASVFMGTVRQ